MKREKVKEVHTLYCSFCGKSQYEVKKLIAGPTVFICNECVDLCQEICIMSDAENQVRREMRDRGQIIVSKADAERLAWLRTWTTSPPAKGPDTPAPARKPSHIVVG